MCDYSLEHVVSRPAAVADRLIVTPFSRTITRGFAAQGDLNTVICLLPGTEIAFDDNIRFEHLVTHVTVTIPDRVARFRQVDMHLRHAHHDALELADGTIVPLTRLIPGQRATVLQLPSVPLHQPQWNEQAAKRPTALSVASVHHHDRDGRVGEHLVGDAAEQNGRKSAAPV